MAAHVTRMTKRRLGELLQAEGLVSEEQVKQAKDEQRKKNLFLGEALVKLGFVTEDSIALTITQQFNLPYLSVGQYDIPKDVLDLFPASMLREYQFLPLERMGDMLIIAGAGLMNHDVLDELERLVGCEVRQYVSTWREIQNKQDELYKDQKKDSQDELTDLGSLLLDESDGKLAAVKESVAEPVDAELAGMVSPVQAESTERDSDEIAAAVEALTGGGTSEVLQEALAAVEGGGAPAGGAGDPASPKKKPSSLQAQNVTPYPKPGQKMSAFAAGAKGKSPAGGSGARKAVEVPEAQPGAKAEQAEGGEGDAAKRGLLGFLKKK